MPHPETDLEETLETGQNPMTQLQKAIEDLSPLNIEIKLYLLLFSSDIGLWSRGQPERFALEGKKVLPNVTAHASDGVSLLRNYQFPISLYSGVRKEGTLEGWTPFRGKASFGVRPGREWRGCRG